MQKQKERNEWRIIESLIGKGEEASAVARLEKVATKKLAPLERIAGARLLFRVGKTAKAIRLLGKLYSPRQFKALSRETLCLQATHAQYLNFLGAKYVSIEILSAIEASGQHGFRQFFPHYLRIRAGILMLQGKFEAAKKEYANVLSLYPAKSSEAQFARIVSADACEAMGENAEAFRFLEEVRAHAQNGRQGSELFIGISEQAAAEFAFRRGDLPGAALHLSAAEPYFRSGGQSRDFAYLKKWQGIVAFETGKNGESQLLEAKRILSADISQPVALIDLFYWLEKYLPEEISLSDRIALRAYPGYCPYSVLAGREVGGEQALATWFAEGRKTAGNDCWVIEDGSIRPESYRAWRKNGGVSELDLYSCVSTRKGKIFPLSRIQGRFLLGVIGGGSIGLHEIALADFVYRQKFDSWENAFDRVRALAKELRPAFPLWEREKGYFRLSVQKLPRRCVLPMRFDVGNPVQFLSGRESPLTARAIAEGLGISARTANRFVQEAIEEGLLSKTGSGKFVEYIFR